MAAENNRYALSFQGSGSVVLDNLPVNTEIGARTTVEFWMKWSGADSVMPFGWNGLYNLWFISGWFGFNCGDGILYGVSSAGMVNTWVHVCAVFDNGSIFGEKKLYINGERVETPLRRGVSWNKFTSVTPRAYISGWGYDDSFKFRGLIDEFRIWNYERTPDQIKVYYDKIVPCNSEGLIAYLRMEEGVGTLTSCVDNGVTVSKPAQITWVDAEVPLSYPLFISFHENPVVIERGRIYNYGFDITNISQPVIENREFERVGDIYTISINKHDWLSVDKLRLKV